MQVNERRPHLPRVSATLLASSVILLSCLSLPLIRIQAFVPSSTRSSGSCGYSYSSSTSQCNTATSTRLLYAMPDVQSMKATEMKEELQSYGINTNTLFDKHDFEHALQEARRLYEQTLDDVMASTRPKEKTKKKATTTGFDAQSQQSSQSQSKSQSQQRARKTVNYDRARHQDERIFTTDVNARQNQHQHEPQFETAFGGNQHYQNHHQQQERQHQQQHHHSQQQQQERPRRQRQQRHYQASPDQVGPNFHEYNTANNNANNWDGRRRPQRPPRQAFEVDPMYAHEAQHQHQGGGGFYGDGYGHQQHHQEYHHEQRQYDDSYEVGGQQQHQHQQHQPRSYVDPEVNMKYQAALMEAYNMKVEDLQRELNTRGVSTKYCMVFKDFCHEYAEAIADNKQKKVVIKVTRSSDVEDNDEDDDDDEDEEDDDDEDESSTFGDDEDYDPSYRDVVMQKYDPSMWI